MLRKRRYFGQPDGGLNGFDLAEERANAAEIVVSPMLKQTPGFRRDLPLLGNRQIAPSLNVAANLIDN